MTSEPARVAKTTRIGMALVYLAWVTFDQCVSFVC